MLGFAGRRLLRHDVHSARATISLRCKAQTTWQPPLGRQIPPCIRLYAKTPPDSTDIALQEYKQSMSMIIPPISMIQLRAVTQNINRELIGQEIQVLAWLKSKKKMSKNLLFAELWTFDSSLQAVVNAPSDNAAAQERLKEVKEIREQSAIVARGRLVFRENATKSTDDRVPIDSVELVLTKMECINRFPDNIIYSKDVSFPAEQRHLQLRFDTAARKKIALRGRIINYARKYLIPRSFVEIDTPSLFRSTPEGAREFIVPTRKQGMAYALTQSPQQYKQILMSSGFSNYFQIAKCFRDEDLRADRQPEFTQLDLEMAWANGTLVRRRTQGLMDFVFSDVMENTVPVAKWTSITYEWAMAKYGIDKPDLRMDSRIRQLKRESFSIDFLSRLSSLPDAVVDTSLLSFCRGDNLGFYKQFWASPEAATFDSNPDGAPAYVYYEDGNLKMRIGGETLDDVVAKPLLAEVVATLPPNVLTPFIEEQGLLITQARPNEPFSGGSTAHGRLRVALWKAALKANLVEENQWRQFRPLWVMDFPLFTAKDKDDDAGAVKAGEASFSSTHHPFTAPRASRDVDLLRSEPLKARADHYDMVLNGVEVGGGSTRIHSADVQRFIMKDLLKMSDEVLDSFAPLLEALRAGCPPHAGFAFGLERLTATLMFDDSIRNCIAFPKDTAGRDPLVKSPARITEEQLQTYRLQVRQ